MRVNNRENLGKIWVKTGVDQMQNAENLLRFYTNITGITPKQLRDFPQTRTISALRTQIGTHLYYETTLSLDELGRHIGWSAFRRPINEKTN